MQPVFSSLLCFSIAILLGITCNLCPEPIANILRSVISSTLLFYFLSFFFKPYKVKNRIIFLSIAFYSVCAALVTAFSLGQTFNSTFATSFFLIIFPFFILLFLVSILLILVISIFKIRDIISKIILGSEGVLLLSWGVLLIIQGHNIQNTLDIFAISFSILLAVISLSVKYVH